MTNIFVPKHLSKTGTFQNGKLNEFPLFLCSWTIPDEVDVEIYRHRLLRFCSHYVFNLHLSDGIKCRDEFETVSIKSTTLLSNIFRLMNADDCRQTIKSRMYDKIRGGNLMLK